MVIATTVRPLQGTAPVRPQGRRRRRRRRRPSRSLREFHATGGQSVAALGSGAGVVDAVSSPDLTSTIKADLILFNINSENVYIIDLIKKRLFKKHADVLENPPVIALSEKPLFNFKSNFFFSNHTIAVN